MSTATLEKTTNGVAPGENKEGVTTKAVEKYTSKLPSGLYMGLAMASIGLSLYLKSKDRDKDALFVGQWVAPFLLLGIYNKMVKVQGSE